MIRWKLLAIALFFCACLATVNATPVLIDLNGEKVDFVNLKGKWVLINYWASWCKPCLDEIAELNKFYQTKKTSVALYAVNFDSLPLQEQLQLIKVLDIQYPSLMDDPSKILGLEQVRGVPATFVFNPQGQLSTTLYGGQTVSSLNAAIKY